MRKIILLLLCVILPLGALGEEWKIAPYTPETLEIASNRHTQMDDERKAQPFLDTEGFELVAQSPQAALYLSREYHTLRLVDKRTGYVWGAIPLTDARNLNKSWKSYAASIVSIECYDRKNNEKRYGMANDAAKVSYTLCADGFDAEVTFPELKVGLTASVRLTENRLSFSIDHHSIWESGEYRIKSIAFMPYLGSVYENEVPGWFLLPDGPGALMRFQKSESYVAGYDKRIYGNDLAVGISADAQSIGSTRPDDYIQTDSQVLMPVYGIVHGVGQNGLLCVVEDGDLYASIVATPAGLGNTKYNSVMTRFEVRQKYNMSTNQSGAGAAVPQEVRNTLSPALTVHLLCHEQADYDQMAVYYRNLLNMERALDKKPAMRVEVLCAEAKDSYLPGATAVLTTLAEAQQIVTELQESDMAQLLLELSHYTQKNLSGGGLSTGSKEELSALQSLVEAGGGRLCLWLDPVSANKEQINLRLEAANGMGLSPICMTRNNYTLLYPDTYFFRPSKVSAQTARAQKEYAGYAFAVDQAAYRLYGDYTTGQTITRTQSADVFMKALDGIRMTALYTPNQPVWHMAQSFLNMPLVAGQYLYETDTVPFLPIVLSGCKEMYAVSMNLGAFSRDRMLRMIEYGMLPSFTITDCENRVLAQTALSDYASTCFDDWKAFMQEAWQYMRPALAATCGKAVLSHQLIAQGRVCVTWEDGTRLYVNYTDALWQIPEGSVQPHDYLLWEVTQ